MSKFFLTAFAILGLALPACLSGDPDKKSDSDDTDTCATGHEACGTQCMPEGNSCCPDDSLSCAAGTLCNLDNACVRSTSDQTGCLAGRERCGAGCMPVGSACCDDDGSYCKPGTKCVANDKCQATGDAPVTSPPTGNTIVTVIPSGNASMGACGICPGSGSWYTCSPWMPGDKCSWQSCVCAFQINGSDVTKEWYQTGAPDHVTGCFQCDTVNTTCVSAAQNMINTCYDVGG